MRISYTDEQERLRQRLRAYFAELMTPDRREALTLTGGEYGDGTVSKEVVRQMGADGWLALGWPAEYGGQQGSMLDQLIFTDEAAIAGAPVPFLTINTVGPTIMKFGTAKQKAFYLPPTCRGSPPVSSISRSATPSPRPARTWRRCAPARSATATST
jgi:3-oxocholest-4-en-26-oyl-CoA dehydrogenase alpha subunit